MGKEKAKHQTPLLTLNGDELTEAVRDWLRKHERSDVLHGKVHYKIDREGNPEAVVTGDPAVAARVRGSL